MTRVVPAPPELTLLVLLGCLPACMGPRPFPPPGSRVETPAAWRHGNLSSETAVSDHWWAEFGDPTLNGIVEESLRDNDDVQIALARVSEARAALRLSRAALLPQAELQAAGTREAGASPFGLADQESGGGFGATIAYDIDLFGRLRSEEGAARARFLASQGSRDVVRLVVASSAAASYISLCGLDARLEIARSTLSLRSDSLRVAQRRYDLGYSPALDLKQAEAEFLAAKRLIPELHLAIERQENSLSILLGNAPHRIDRASNLPGIRIPAIPHALPSSVIAQRPDIYTAEENLVATDHELSSARAAFLPNITLEGGAGRAFSTLYPLPISIWSVGGSVLAPLFEGGALRAQQQIAASRRDQAAFVYRRTVLTAFEEVEDQMTTIEDSGAQLEVLMLEEDALTVATRLATRRYRTGYSSYLEQIDAERSLLDAQLAVVQERVAQLLAYVDLFRALGGGWHRNASQSSDLQLSVENSKLSPPPPR